MLARVVELDVIIYYRKSGERKLNWCVDVVVSKADSIPEQDQCMPIVLLSIVGRYYQLIWYFYCGILSPRNKRHFYIINKIVLFLFDYEVNNLRKLILDLDLIKFILKSRNALLFIKIAWWFFMSIVFKINFSNKIKKYLHINWHH